LGRSPQRPPISCGRIIKGIVGWLKFAFSSGLERWVRGLLVGGIGLAVVLGAVLSGMQPLNAQPQSITMARTYPLPAPLANLPDRPDCGNYLAQLNVPKVGALIWTQFPVTVLIDRGDSQAPREAVWLAAVHEAIRDWQVYLPIVVVDDPAANITIRRRSVPLRRDPQTGQTGRARLAETQFTIFASADQRVVHRMTIDLNPNQADAALLSGARHELGHALGLWGHSDQATDVMYFSQVAQPSGISCRDVNTLKQVYQSATHLGESLGAVHHD
jgi:predicted Zn-dependent protease